MLLYCNDNVACICLSICYSGDVYILSIQIVYSILGINRRNLEYIKKLNPQKNIRLADNKYKTKQFLEQRGIPVPKTYAHITERKQLLDFDFGSLPSDVFVAKPNKWSKWKWIFILKRLPSVSHESNHWIFQQISASIEDYLYRDLVDYPYGYTYRDTVLSDRVLKKKLVAVLEWNYTLANRPDTILVEEKILPGSGFEQFCEYGLADIRVIVCNLVPVAAMLRVPTAKSWWVANLAQGGMAFGVDIATWQIRTLATDSKIYYKDFPEEYKHLYKFTIPFWDDILLHSANIQYFVNMGYIWVDWVITADGPKLLEVNGKAWLEIQNIIGMPLQRSLDKITDLDISTPQKWLEIARSLFAPAKDTSIPQSKVLYLSQKWTLSLTNEQGTEDIDIVIVAKPNRSRNYASLEVIEAIKNADHIHLKTGTTLLKDVSLYGSDRLYGHRIELGTQVLKNYYIKPIHKSQANIKFINPKNILESEVDELMILDKKLHDIAKKLPLLKILFPTNYLDEFDKFVSHQGKYNPIFSYNFPTYKEITAWRSALKELRDEHSGPRKLQSPFAQLFYDKFDEVEDKINLIYAYKKQDYVLIRQYNEKLFGSIDEQQVLQSQNLMHFRDPAMYTADQKIDIVHIRQMIKHVFLKYWIKRHRLLLDSWLLGRISFLNARIPTIKLSPTFHWTAWELAAQLEHEIWVHLCRAVNGTKTKRMILQKWTAWYLRDEEWLAVYQSEKTAKQYFPNFYNATMHRKYVSVDFSEKMSFVELTWILKDMNPRRTLSWLFRAAIRLKRWCVDTSLAQSWTTFFKDKVYLDGYKKISQWVDDWGKLEDLMVGKIKIEDLDFIL